MVRSTLFGVAIVLLLLQLIASQETPSPSPTTTTPAPTTFPPHKTLRVYLPPKEEAKNIVSLLDKSVNVQYPSGLIDKLRGDDHQYSRFRCVGDDNSADNMADRACVFFNLCYDRYTEKFNFYRKQKRTILYDARHGELNHFKSNPYGFVLLNYMEHFGWAPETIEATIPTEDVTHVKKQHVLFRHWIPQFMNLGHFLWEDLLGSFAATKRLGLNDENIQIMDMNGHDQHPLFIKFKPLFLGMSAIPPVDFKTYMNEQLNQTRHICFEQLQAGGPVGAFQRQHRLNNHGREALFEQFRANVLKRHGIDPRYVPKKHTIAVVKKTNKTFKRDIANFAEVVAFLKKTYPTIDVIEIDYAKLSIQQQLELMMNITVFISPAGGVSMMAPFLPTGSHAIFMDFHVTTEQYGFDKDTSGSMEGAFWNHWNHFKRNYYQVRKQGLDYVFDYAGASDARWYASILVDTTRLQELVDGALEDMEA